MRKSFVRAIDKLKSLKEISGIAQQLKEQGLTIVTTNGCFDLLHIGHLHSLEESRAKGDVLIVGLNSDESIKRYKGSLRPIVPEKERALMLASFECVTYTTIFEEDDPIVFLQAVRPDIHCKGAEYSDGSRAMPEKPIVESYGGRIDYISLINEKSTTKMISALNSNQ
jgi:rfaE bifunctional protein nucleotidyltransferase chain/domain